MDYKKKNLRMWTWFSLLRIWTGAVSCETQ